MLAADRRDSEEGVPVKQVEFADPTGAFWHPRMTYGIMKEVFRRTGIRLWVLGPLDNIDDPYKVSDMVYETVRDEATERGVTPEAWRALWEQGPMMTMLAGFHQAQDAFAYGTPKDKEAAEGKDAPPTILASSGPPSGSSAP